jgi:hypothetical protein
VVLPLAYKDNTAGGEKNNAGARYVSKNISAVADRFDFGLCGGSVRRTGCSDGFVLRFCFE